MNRDHLIQLECLDFIRLSISQSNSTAASILATEIKELCQSGQANRHKIWAELSPDEQERFRELLCSSCHH